jgi:hypothetical protein
MPVNATAIYFGSQKDLTTTYEGCTIVDDKIYIQPNYTDDTVSLPGITELAGLAIGWDYQFPDHSVQNVLLPDLEKSGFLQITRMSNLRNFSAPKLTTTGVFRLRNFPLADVNLPLLTDTGYLNIEGPYIG